MLVLLRVYPHTYTSIHPCVYTYSTTPTPAPKPIIVPLPPRTTAGKDGEKLTLGICASSGTETEEFSDMVLPKTTPVLTHTPRLAFIHAFAPIQLPPRSHKKRKLPPLLTLQPEMTGKN